MSERTVRALEVHRDQMSAQDYDLLVSAVAAGRVESSGDGFWYHEDGRRLTSFEVAQER